ncbi:hypothetical protein FOMPIDRAFT_92804 [Fomitopsis schrenkii]|uniref:C2H2-type domain-containing protein n=1 Tax=Fomitopsis schrenkii TaxID=2126942 RepID=S8DPQ0_FOMSC|nr:hypothetical protein FOMPIDRAFT_92804 [Fomitopsis schrenkii]
MAYNNDYTGYSLEQVLALTDPSFAELAEQVAAFHSFELDFDYVSSSWIDFNAVTDDQPVTAHSWAPRSSDSEASSASSATATPSLKRKRSALDDPFDGVDVATAEDGLRPYKVPRSDRAPHMPAAPTPAFDALGWEFLDGYPFPDIDSAPNFLPAPDFVPAPNFFSLSDIFSAPDFLPIPVSPQPTAPSEVASTLQAGETSLHDEPAKGTPDDREDTYVAAILTTDEGDEETLEVGASTSLEHSSAPAPDAEPEVAQPAPRPRQWVVKNPDIHMGLEGDRRVGQTDLWLADAPVAHRRDRLQPCDVQGCGAHFKHGSVSGFTRHDGRTHKRLQYLCPRPGCNKAFGRPDVMKTHLVSKPLCGAFAVGILQDIYGQGAVPAMDRVAPYQFLPYFATMKP